MSENANIDTFSETRLAPETSIGAWFVTVNTDLIVNKMLFKDDSWRSFWVAFAGLVNHGDISSACRKILRHYGSKFLSDVVYSAKHYHSGTKMCAEEDHLSIGSIKTLIKSCL